MQKCPQSLCFGNNVYINVILGFVRLGSVYTRNEIEKLSLSELFELTFVIRVEFVERLKIMIPYFWKLRPKAASSSLV